LGTKSITLAVTDSSGQTATCNALVTLEDNIAPSITCPSDITVNNTPGTCGAIVNYTAPVGTDNCSGSTTSQTAGLASGATFPVGTTTNTFEVTDAAGNKTSCSFTVNVTYTTAPTFTYSPASLTISCSASSLPADTNGLATATDNCATPTINYTDSEVNGVGNNKVITRTWTATDANSNVSSYVQTITVTDTTAPTFTFSPASLKISCSAKTQFSQRQQLFSRKSLSISS
jgi:large repetitive protein